MTTTTNEILWTFSDTLVRTYGTLRLEEMGDDFAAAARKVVGGMRADFLRAAEKCYTAAGMPILARECRARIDSPMV